MGAPWAQGAAVCCRRGALSGVGSVLLSGPSGSGKLTAVRAVCTCLNLHLCKVTPPVASALGIYNTQRTVEMVFEPALPSPLLQP